MIKLQWLGLGLGTSALATGEEIPRHELSTQSKGLDGKMIYVSTTSARTLTEQEKEKIKIRKKAEFYVAITF